MSPAFIRTEDRHVLNGLVETYLVIPTPFTEELLGFEPAVGIDEGLKKT
jgi:hypothetical protein